MRLRFVLAREMSRTVAELGESMSARELVWWQALYEVEAEERQKAEEAQARRRR